MRIIGTKLLEKINTHITKSIYNVKAKTYNLNPFNMEEYE